MADKIQKIVAMLDPEYQWTEKDHENVDLQELFRECCNFDEIPETENSGYFACGSERIKNTTEGLYRLLYLVQPKTVDFTDMYKSCLFIFRSADARFLVEVDLFKYELGLYFYAPKECIAGKGSAIIAGAPGSNNGWSIADEMGRAFFDMVVKATNSKWMIYRGNNFEV